ncbi:stress responsive protein [Clostridia bacterium]|nr:stress responsive protein [Clostridia bacterium]
MVKHIIFWDHPQGLSDEQKRENIQAIKAALEGLKATVPGIVSINVYSEMLADRVADFVLDSVFVNQEALEAYAVHPDHVKAATEVVRPRVANRRCCDYEI